MKKHVYTLDSLDPFNDISGSMPVQQSLPARDIPQLPLSYWLGKGRNRFINKPAEELLALHKTYGRIIDLNIPFGPTRISINDAELAKQVLVTDHRNYSKDQNTKILRLALGNGLLTNEGEAWRAQRRVIQPAFKRQALSQISLTMQNQTEQWLSQSVSQKQPFDIYAEMVTLTSKIAAQTLFGTDAGDSKALVQAMNIINRFLSKRMFKPFLRTQLVIPSASTRSFKAAYRYLSDLIKSIIVARKKSAILQGDLLDLLLVNSLSQNGEYMTDQQLIDECITLFIAGHETTANALTWTLYLLAKHPEISSHVQKEVTGEINKHKTVINALPTLSYTKQVIKESLRLYPPAWVIGRENIKDGQLGGYRIKKSTQIMLNIYALHRNPDYWNQPDTFDPERFNSENASQNHNHAHIPFGSGNRICIGKHYSMMEMQLVLAMIMQQGRLRLVNDQTIQARALVTLKPANQVLMQWH